MSKTNLILAVIIALFFFVVTVFVVRPFDSVALLRFRTFSLSVGERRQAWLALYRHYLDSSDFVTAKQIEPHLDPFDAATLKSEYYPELLAARLNQLIYKSDKTPEDWMEIAKYQLKLGLLSQAKESLRQASLLDPLRDDIHQLYLQLN